jgi:Rod binding domain-containing protein
MTNPADVSFQRAGNQTKHQMQALEAAGKSGNHKAIRSAAETFESQFMSQMLNHMYKGIDSNGMFGGGHAEAIWRDHYIQEVGNVVAKRGGIGVADIIERQLLALQEAA